VLYTDPVVARPGDLTGTLRSLVADMNAGAVQLLLILSANPVYTAPVDLDFATVMKKVPTSVHLGLYADETAAASTWHIPETHFLEAWSDARAFDGTATIMQPLIEPLYADAHSAHEILPLFGGSQRTSYDEVRRRWEGQQTGGDFETWWRDALNRGVIPDSALPAITPALDQAAIASALQAAATADSAQGLEINFRPDPAIWDGRFANNAWLQEMPKPLNLLTWDNAVMMSPTTAEQLGLVNEDLAEVRYGGRAVQGGVWIWPGHADNSITLHLGYGRSQTGAGSVASSTSGTLGDLGNSPQPLGKGSPLGSGTGFNAFALRTADAPWFDGGAEVVKTGGKYRLATTQFHWQMEGRELVKTGTLAEYQENPKFLGEPHETISLYPQWEYPNNKWGMAIDLTACVGCNACVVACQAENNVPTVGKEGVYRQREMHWLRVDRYYEGSDIDDPQTVFQPVPCMQCETAPCEVVRPGVATTHSEDGLNDMV
jgi:molybdopterin-containing oxidoreductase family iron-sulfur binding subunit